MKNLFLALTFLLMIGCAQPASKVVNYPSFVDPSKDNTWGGDVRLSIVDIDKKNQSTVYNLKSVYGRDTVGFKLVLPDSTDKSGSGSGLELLTAGKISKNFKNALASVYKVKEDTSRLFPDKITLEFVNLDKFTLSTLGKEASDKNGFTDYKVFFEDQKNSDDGEAELFINVNEKDRIVVLGEKDEEYRKGLIGYFTR